MKHYVLYIFLVLCGLAEAQNLVPNPSFENYTSCPTYSQFNKIVPWCGLAGYEDPYNTCTNGWGVVNGVPYEQYGGFQYARTGNGMGSVIGWINIPSHPNSREYIHVPLIDTLKIKKYCGTMYVNFSNASQNAIDRLGMYFSSNSFPCSQGTPTVPYIPYMPVSAQVENNTGNIISDTLNWIEISGVFIANGNEKYLTIGNFHDDAATTVVKTNPSALLGTNYYMIDDVSLEEVHDAQCTNDTTLCSPDSVLLGNNVSEAAVYSWSPSTGLSCNTCPNPKAYVSQSTTYTLTKKQCKVITTDQVTITIKNDCGLVNIPNVFTPNEDGINDTFSVTLPTGYSFTDFSVYNRWGNIIYQPELKNKSVLFWDGHTTSGEKVSDGTYFYTIKYINGDGNTVEKKGCISLFR